MQLSDTQENIIGWTTLISPLVGLAFVASKSDGAFRRAGKTGLVTSLVGSTGTGALFLYSTKRSEDGFGNTMFGSALGAVGGGVCGIVGSFFYDAVRNR